MLSRIVETAHCTRLSWLASVEGSVLLSWEQKRNEEWEKGRAVIVWNKCEHERKEMRGKEKEEKQRRLTLLDS